MSDPELTAFWQAEYDRIADTGLPSLRYPSTHAKLKAMMGTDRLASLTLDVEWTHTGEVKVRTVISYRPLTAKGVPSRRRERVRFDSGKGTHRTIDQATDKLVESMFWTWIVWRHRGEMPMDGLLQPGGSL